ncbi:MAG: hypothetical protein ACLGJB_05000 [Blastocatellia bacterium]
MFRKTEDGAIDNLLRAQAGRAGRPPAPCQEFDPDLANAYVEHSLPVRARAHYEQHLSLCAPCRKSVVALARMAEAEGAFAEKSRAASLPREPRWKALLGAMSRPQWAMATAAVVILVISVPLVLSRKGAGVNQPPEQAKLDQPSPSAAAPAEYKASQDNPGGRPVDGGRAQAEPPQQVASSQQDRNAPRPARPAEDSGDGAAQPSAETAGGVAGGAMARSEPPQTQPVEAKPVSQGADQPPAKDIGQVPVPAQDAAAPPPQQAAAEEKLAKIDSDKAKSVAEQGKEKVEVSVLQPGRPDGESRAGRDAVVRPGEITPPPAPSTGSRGRNAMTSPPGGINSRLTDPARNRGRGGERKINGKKFWLKDGTWVDKDYNPDKDMPVVTFVRDSDVYKEHLAKRQGLKSYLNGFDDNERVILIYKGTVYMIVPQ